MYLVKLKCRVITPMFMAGADGRSPELRPSEFKGMMRFWWRAIKAEDDIEKLKKEEAEIFGGSGEGQGKSKVRIKVYPQPNNQFFGYNLKNDYQLHWYFDKNSQSLAGRDKGIGYLLYSTVLREQERKYVKPDFEFFIEITSQNESAYKNAIASLWASIYLGGFGTRSRRGGGNIEILNCSGDLEDCLEFIPQNVSTKDDLAIWLAINIKKIKEIIRVQNRNLPKYTILKNSRIIILDPENSWWEALNKIGEEYFNFRKVNKSSIFDMGAFGMPIVHNRSRIRIVPYENNKRISERMASPLIMKLIKINLQYFPVIVKLSTFLQQVGKEEKRRNGWNRQEVRNIGNLNNIIDQFLNNLSNKKEIVL